MLSTFQNENKKESNKNSKKLTRNNSDIENSNAGDQSGNNDPNRSKEEINENSKTHDAKLESNIRFKHALNVLDSKGVIDLDRLAKPTYASLKRGRVLPRDPITNHTVSQIEKSKIFSP